MMVYPGPTKAPSTRHRFPRIGLAVALGLSLIWPFSLALPFGVAHAAATPVRFVPTTALAYAEMNFRPTGSQGSSWNQIVTTITHQKGYQHALNALMGGSSSSTGLSQVQNVMNGLGNHTGIALFAAGTAKNPSANALIFVPPVKASGSPMDLFNAFKGLFDTVQPAGLYYGHLLYTVKMQGISVPGSIVDGMIILAASESRQQADHLLRVSLDAGDGRRPSLGASATFTKVTTSLPAQRLGYVFVNSQQLLRWATDLGQQAGALAAGGMSPTDIKKLLTQAPPIAIALSAVPRGLQIVSSAFTTSAGMTQSSIISASTAQYAGRDALTYMDFAGLGNALLQSVHTANMAAGATSGSSADVLHSTLGLGALEQQLHLNIERDVLPLLNGDLGISLSIKPGFLKASNPLQVIQARVALQLTDAAKTGAVLAHVNSWVRKQTGMQWVRISPTTQGMQEPSLGMGYKMNKQWLFAGTGINEHWSGGLNSTTNFVEAMHYVADTAPSGKNRPTSLVYFNIDPMLPLLEETLSRTDLTTYNREAKPLLTALHSLTFASRTTSGGEQSVAIFIGIH